jgi:TetR/AcrR family transcriptional regulator, transcriptional repressor of aconitase
MPRVSAAYLAKRRAHVLEAAARCFAREGFHRTTMQHIVREAALSPGALYRYFASKEDIVAAIASERHAAERALFREARGRDGARAGVAGLARAFLGRVGEPGEREWRRVTIQLWGEALRNPRVMRVVRSGLDEPVRRLTALLRAGRRDGSLRRDLDAPATARVAAAVFEGLVLQQAWEPRMDVDRFVRAAERLLQGLAPPAGQRRGLADRRPRRAKK